MTLRIVLIDDHLLFREGLSEALKRDPRYELVGEAEDARAAYQIVDATDPDLVIVDVGLPGTNGIALVRELVRRERRRRVLVLTMHCEADFAAQAFAAGAGGYALKHQSLEDIKEAIAAVMAGHRYCAPRIDRTQIDTAMVARQDGEGPLAVLSPREREVFDMLVRGYSNRGIAEQLAISAKTVDTHRTRIMRKLSIHSIGELVRYAARHHLLSDLPSDEPEASLAEAAVQIPTPSIALTTKRSPAPARL
jgi:two-component system secretion response regulator SsrB